MRGGRRSHTERSKRNDSLSSCRYRARDRSCPLSSCRKNTEKEEEEKEGGRETIGECKDLKKGWAACVLLDSISSMDGSMTFML